MGPGVQVVAHVPVAEPVPPPISVVMPRGDGHVDLLRADEVDVGVDAARGADPPFAGDDLGARPDHQPGIDAGLRQRIAGLADGHDPALPNADVALDDPPVVDDHRVGDDQVAVLRAHRLVERALILTVPDRLAAAEDRLLAVVGIVLLDLDDQFGVGQPDAVADGRAVLLGVRFSREFHAHGSMPSARSECSVMGTHAARHLDGFVAVSWSRQRFRLLCACRGRPVGPSPGR